MANPQKWYGLKYPDSELVGLAFRFARPPSAGLAALDAGCGPGRHVQFLAELGYRATGIDSDPKMVELARQNGVEAVQADFHQFKPAERPHLVVAWGLVMLARSTPAILASWQPELIIMDWRSEGNRCLTWRGNERTPDGAVVLRKHGHVLDGQKYYFHSLVECEVPGYKRLHWQKLTKATEDESNEWYQTVHQRK
jgi:SAM-dependent methyltransferase